jgi:hypothetical protein
MDSELSFVIFGGIMEENNALFTRKRTQGI